MEKSTFILTYLVTFVFCLAITVGLIIIINDGLKKYFEHLSQDNDIAKFFHRLVNIIILLGGISAALTFGYHIDEDADWLTLTWDAAEQVENSLTRLFITAMILGITFLMLHLIARRTNK